MREMLGRMEGYMKIKVSAAGRLHRQSTNATWENLNLNYKGHREIDAEKCIGCQLCYAACGRRSSPSPWTRQRTGARAGNH